MSKNNKYYLSHGSGWEKHEDFLVDNEAGLLKLKEQIDVAIEQGKSNESNGDFVGVRCLDDDEFDGKHDSLNSPMSNLIGSIMVLIFVAIFFSGLVFIFRSVF